MSSSSNPRYVDCRLRQASFRRCAIVVLLTGASGFIGSRIAEALVAAGHEVLRAARPRVDFARDTTAAAWAPRLVGVDAVINAVGILRERDGQTFDALHAAAPCALFEACAQSRRVRRVLQISALGAQANASTAYHRSKAAADAFLLDRLPLRGVVVQPSLVYGGGGASARLFTLLATLPLLPLPGGGRQLIQPLHVDDAVQAVVALVENDGFIGERVALVGPRPVELRDFIGALRHALGLRPARVVALPRSLIGAVAAVAARLPGSLLDRDTLAMLDRGNVASAEATKALLGRPPRDPSRFVEPHQAPAALAEGRLQWCLPLLRASVAAVWIWTGVVSLGLYPVEQSLQMLHRAGVSPALAPTMLYGAAALDLLLGVLTLAIRRRWLWWTQLGLVAFYSLVIAVRLPEYWLHPYGPMVKNLPMLAAIVLLLVFDDRRRERSGWTIS
jgi:nucleoside-diphosphate-sugar epimerase